jgi:hypothetical protein
LPDWRSEEKHVYKWCHSILLTTHPKLENGIQNSRLHPPHVIVKNCNNTPTSWYHPVIYLVETKPEWVMNQQSTTSSRTTQPGHHDNCTGQTPRRQTIPLFWTDMLIQLSDSQEKSHSSRAVTTKHRTHQSLSHNVN